MAVVDPATPRPRDLATAVSDPATPRSRDAATAVHPASATVVLQLSDSALPTGGFVHSGGIETAWQLGEVAAEGLEVHLARCLRACGRASLPLMTAAHAAPERFAALDRRCEALTTNHVANRASRAQGQGLLAMAAGAFGIPELVTLKRLVRVEDLPAHLAPVSGVVYRLLGVDLSASQELFLFTQLRGWISAAVRLSLIGPLAAQAMQFRLGTLLAKVLAAEAARDDGDLAQTDPLLDLFQGQHDRLYSRLFSS